MRAAAQQQAIMAAQIQAELDAARLGVSSRQAEEELAIKRKAMEEEEREKMRMYAAQDEYAKLIKGGTPAIDALLRIGPKLGPGAGPFVSGAADLRPAPPPTMVNIKTQRGDIQVPVNARTGTPLVQIPEELWMPPVQEGSQTATQILDNKGNPTGTFVVRDQYGREHYLNQPWGSPGALTPVEQRRVSLESQRIRDERERILASDEWATYQALKGSGKVATSDYQKAAMKAGLQMEADLKSLREQYEQLMYGLGPGGLPTPPPMTNSPGTNTSGTLSSGTKWRVVSGPTNSPAIK